PHLTGETSMPQVIEDDYDVGDPIAAERTYRTERRQKVISSLDEVAKEAAAALKEAGLTMPLFFSVPSSGEALLTFATPADPSDPDWAQASQIIINIVETIVGVEGLRSRPLLPRDNQGQTARQSG
ncbi:MAG: hypothetical protein M3Y22_06745, partial [Pseudomonadota bacterium]|nr:hypothetical protein [Pseudomonadota bacterium]